jgi:hypothetical protein
VTNDSKPEVVERWAVAHARANRGHQTKEALDNPGECKTCGEKSPVWDLVEQRGSEWGGGR